MASQKPKSERNKPLQLDDAAFDALTALIAVRDGLATEAQVEDALAEKKKRATQETSPGGEAPPKPRRLAWMLVDDGVLDEAKAKELEKRLDPEVLPGYRILSEVGRGGMGTVFKARQLSMDRIVALKILANRLSKDERYVEKFLHEARAAGKLNHEHIVSAIDCGAASGFHYFVMEFVDGKTAMELLAKDGALPWEKAFEYAEQVARALEHAHANGLVHRDVKPENIMVSQTVTGTRVKLCDLGLAKEAVEAGTGEKSKMTEGTPAYASPEQALGRTDIDAKSDIYSLGATLYHLLSGEPPFDGENARTILWKQVHKPFPDIDKGLESVPAPLRALLARMVVKDREDRLPSARAFLDELAKARKQLANPTTSEQPSVSDARGRRQNGTLAAAVVGLVLLASLPLVYVATRTPDKPDDGATAAGDPVAPPPPPVPQPDPEDQPPKTPKVVRIDDEPKDDPKDPAKTSPPPPPGNGAASNGTLTPSSGDESARSAQLLLDRANQFREQNPDDLQGYSARLRAVVEKYPGTPAAVAAASEIATLESEGRSAVEKDLEKAKTEALGLAEKGKFREAVSALDALSEKWDARVLAPIKPSIERTRQLVLGQAKNRIAALAKEGDQKLSKGEPVDETIAALLALEKEVPADIGKEARARADALKEMVAQAIADAALKEAAQKRDDAFAAGKVDDADKVAQETAKDARVQTRKKELDAFVAETADVVRTWRAFDEKMKSFEAIAKRAYRRKGVPSVDGQLREYDPVTWTAKVKPFGLKELVALDVRDLLVEDLIDVTGAGKDLDALRAATLFFLARGEAEAAAVALDKAIALGLPDDPTFRARIAAFRAQDHEQKARRLVAKALAPNAHNTAPEEVIASVKALAAGFADTASYAEKFDDLKKVYVASRVLRVTSLQDVASVFSGKVTRGSRDQIKLDYEFQKDPGAARDWSPDPGLTKDSALRWQKGREYMKGVVRNIAVWDQGAVTVDARIITPSASRPNVNFIISMKAGWDGVFVGFGFKTANMGQVRVDPKAPNKPGWRVVTPCNLAMDLNGQDPSNAKVLCAEETPNISQGSAIRYSVKRDAKGGLTGTVGSSSPVYVANSPRSDEAGQVAIAGLETELVVEHVEIVGKLEAQWLADRARNLADAEASQFPQPSKSSKTNGNGG